MTRSLLGALKRNRLMPVIPGQRFQLSFCPRYVDFVGWSQRKHSSAETGLASLRQYVVNRGLSELFILTLTHRVQVKVNGMGGCESVLEKSFRANTGILTLN